MDMAKEGKQFLNIMKNKKEFFDPDQLDVILFIFIIFFIYKLFL